MILNYERFSEKITNQGLEGLLAGCDAWIMPYFYMSIRYRDQYYNRNVQDPADTVYFLNLPDASLLFAFDHKRGGSFMARGYRIGREHLKKAWLFMTPLIQSLRQEYFSEGAEDGNAFSELFLANVAAFYDASQEALVPFDFIISSMPDHCFPECRGVRLFNRAQLQDVSKHMSVITGRMIRDAASGSGHEAYSSVFLVPPAKSGGKWQLEYYSNREITQGRRRKAYGVIRENVESMRSDGMCNMTALMQQVDRMAEAHEGK